MKSSEQVPALSLKRNGQAVAKPKARFGKTDVRYWQEVIFKPTYTRGGEAFSVENWAARIQWRGRREVFNLHTANKAAAAAKAKDIYVLLMGAGWDAALTKFKPEMQRPSVSTVGKFLSELRAHWSGKPKTFDDYCRSLRSVIAQIFNIEGGREKFDYATGGRNAWVAQIDAIRLADLSPELVNNWKIAFVRRKAGSNPLEQRKARITCNSIMRQAKSLFSEDLLTHVKMVRPEKLPFEGVAFYPRESMRYHSVIDIEALIRDALGELPQEPLKIFLLATMAGLRRNEIDKLQWPAFRWNDGVVRIATTEHFNLKTTDSGGDVSLDKELLALFRGWHATATGPFVIESDTEPRIGAAFTHYRAQAHFDDLIDWLREKGVTAAKPLHELRKEFGSQICDKYGIYAASSMLRHTDISTTAQHYIDKKKNVTFGLGNLLPTPDNVTAITKTAASDAQQACS